MLPTSRMRVVLLTMLIWTGLLFRCNSKLVQDLFIGNRCHLLDVSNMYRLLLLWSAHSIGEDHSSVAHNEVTSALKVLLYNARGLVN